MATLYVGGRLFDGEKMQDGQAVLEEGGKVKRVAADKIETLSKGSEEAKKNALEAVGVRVGKTPSGAAALMADIMRSMPRG